MFFLNTIPKIIFLLITFLIYRNEQLMACLVQQQMVMMNKGASADARNKSQFGTLLQQTAPISIPRFNQQGMNVLPKASLQNPRLLYKNQFHLLQKQQQNSKNLQTFC